MDQHYGASASAWAAWRALGVGEDLLPSVANPNATLSPVSKLQAIGKVPSRYNAERQVVGIGKWTTYMASPNELDQWAAEPDYALSVKTSGAIKGIDVDVDNPKISAQIRKAVVEVLGPCPVRYRDNSGKLLIPIRYSGVLPKRVLQVDGGMIEILGDGQQFIADGWHTSGVRYLWNSAPLEDMVDVTLEQLEELCAMLELVFGTGEWKIAREKRDGVQTHNAGADDVAGWLVDNWTTYDGAGPELYIDCPFKDSHTSDSGPSATAYFPAGSGGYQRGHFVCLHAHCAGREDREFLSATGYSASEFADLAPEVAHTRTDVVQLELVRDKQGRIEATADNLVKLCSRPMSIGKTLAFDEFKDELVWAPAGEEPEQWRAFGDVDYVDVRIELERRGMKPMGQDLLRSTIMRAAFERHMDTAQVWLGRLMWDGVERVESFCVAGWGWEATDYSAAVGRYIWTAMAGRVLDPGCQCDMAPILVGAQGVGKTSAIKAMVPDEGFYTTIPLDGHDDDTARRLRGKLVGELEELRGLNSRHIEEIKAWLTRTSEEWVPKYKEFSAKFKRRCLFFGSTNDDEFLNDPTGERRWLPGRCGVLDIDWIKAHRDQLWAEGAARFAVDGVDWRGAAELSLDEHHEFKVTDSWEPPVVRWLAEPQLSGLSPSQEEQVLVSDVLSGAVNLPVAQHDRVRVLRMVKVLRGLGWERRRLGVQADGSRPWVYVREGPQA